MALSEIYVDPDIGADSGLGTLISPFGDLEYGIRQTTFDTVNGTRVNIKSGTAEVLVSNLEVAMADTSVTPAWAPGRGHPAIFQGYTAAANDRGVAEIDGDGSGICTDDSLSWTYFIDLELHNCGTDDVLALDNQCLVLRCEIHDSTQFGVDCDNYSVVKQCHIYDIGTTGFRGATGSRCTDSLFTSGPTNDFAIAISGGGNASTIERNIVSVTGAGHGILTGLGICRNNSIYSDGGTGEGIRQISTQTSTDISNNLIEGFSGSGGKGMNIASTADASYVGGNSVYDCETAFDLPTIMTEMSSICGENEVLLSSPFTDAANQDFLPLNVGSVKEGSIPGEIG